MARNFLYVHERVYIEMNNLQSEFKKVAINGKRTSRADIKRIKDMISSSSYIVAQECKVLMSFPKWHIEGKEVVLGEPLIMPPDCRLVSIEQLEDIEYGRKR